MDVIKPTEPPDEPPFRSTTVRASAPTDRSFLRSLVTGDEDDVVDDLLPPEETGDEELVEELLPDKEE